MKKAFTLIELIFVISILTFVGLFGIRYISSAYESYIMQKVTDSLETDASAILEQISKRVSDGIKESFAIANQSYACTKLLSQSSGEEASVFMWIGGDKELLNGFYNGSNFNMPAISKFIDLNSSTNQTLISTGSSSTYTQNILTLLANKNSVLDNFIAIYFGNQNSMSCNSFFTQNQNMNVVSSFNGDVLTLATMPTFIAENYSASWSAYAIEYKSAEQSLYLKYNFRPWLGENANSGQTSLLAKNVTAFGAKFENGAIRLNICLTKNIANFPINICKESLIY